MQNVFTGINVGSISIKIATIDDNNRILSLKVIPHQGQPQKILDELSKDQKYAEMTQYFGVSGYPGHITESAAIQAVLHSQETRYDAVISLGGEAFSVFILKNNTIQQVLAHNRCAAGSGEFLIQQISRLNLSIEEAVEKAKSGHSIKLASRCSVHTKSDITHKLNRQEASIEDILWSLHESMASKIVSLMEKINRQIDSVLVIGGVSQNPVMISALKKLLPHTTISVLGESVAYEAYGTALLVKDSPECSLPQYSFPQLFDTSRTLKDSKHLVKIIKPKDYSGSINGESLVLGIDGGSTTTKAVIINSETRDILASHYTKTNGNPIAATKECIESIISQIGNQDVSFISTTGSAREIIGAYLGISAVYNEISAHAEGALSFDPEVDTIFEIGGQDAKYIYIENGLPVDYTMNAACSAGTGSFLEESAQGDLGISVLDISEIALGSPSPVEFKAECAAFINSDIRSALQDGYSKENIMGGLVSSIVNNYMTKVKGRRRVGKKVFFQGGVAKNQAVAYAFALYSNKQLIVPPHPELMGAFGTAIMVLQREKDQIQQKPKGLTTLIEKTMDILGNFICRTCDNYCTINRYKVGDRKFAFGGKCSKYESNWKNQPKTKHVDDYVERRNEVVFSVMDEEYISTIGLNRKVTIGIPKALTTHLLLPLYYSFLKNLGVDVIVSDIHPDGEFKINAPFCFPIQVAHGAVLDLIEKDKQGEIDLDFVFFPQIKKMEVQHQQEVEPSNHICPVTQASPYVLKKAFPNVEFLTPTLDFTNGYESTDELVNLAVECLGILKNEAQEAYHKAVAKQYEVEMQLDQLAREALDVATKSSDPAILLVGRSYNAYPKETSQSVGRKLASKGIVTIPFDSFHDTKSEDTAWHFSNKILDAVKLSQKHENLFILYISNFGCNIDAFTHEYLRKIIGTKPYLKLDIDSHTADAGTQTRLEAFIDIINNYRTIAPKEDVSSFSPSRIKKSNDQYLVNNSENELLQLTDPRVKLHFPVFSTYHNETFPMIMGWLGFNVPPPLELSTNQLNLGLQVTSGSECLPLPIIMGQILEIYQNKHPDDLLGFYIFVTGAPCVAASYADALQNFIEECKMENVFLFIPSRHNNFYGMDKLKMFRYFPLAVGLADIMVEMSNVLSVIGSGESTKQLRSLWFQFLRNSKSKSEFDKNLNQFIHQVSSIPTIKDIDECSKILVTGDFFVRFDDFFFQGIIEKYAEHDIILKPVDLNEFLIYSNYDNAIQLKADFNSDISKKEILRAIPQCFSSFGRKYLGYLVSIKILERYEQKIRKMFEKTGLLVSPINDIHNVLVHAKDHIDISIYGESVVTVGKGVETIFSDYHGLMVLGPFSCLPFRISEAILKPLAQENDYPILTFETDGRTIPPSFLRLVDIHIEQILRRKRFIEDSDIVPLNLISV